jgi:hypothetical protein
MSRRIQVLKKASSRMQKGSGTDATIQCAVIRISTIRFRKGKRRTSTLHG